MNRTRAFAAIIAVIAAMGCSDLGPGPQKDHDNSIDVAALGRYTIAEYESATAPLPTDTPDGPFVSLWSSTGNDRVGSVNGRLAVWPAGATGPTYMFPADTADELTPFRINTRLEVALVRRYSGNYGIVYLWRDGKLAQVAAGGGSGSAVEALNNRGTLIVSSQLAGLYSNFGVVRSPFSPEVTPSTRLAGKTCPEGRRTSAVKAINDDDELLAEIQVNPGGPVETMWIAVGADGSQRNCLDLTQALGDRLTGSARFDVLGAAGRIGGTTWDGHVTSALVTDGAHVAAVDDLLVDESARAQWHVTQVLAIDRDQVIIARATRKADGVTLSVKLTPEPR